MKQKCTFPKNARAESCEKSMTVIPIPTPDPMGLDPLSFLSTQDQFLITRDFSGGRRCRGKRSPVSQVDRRAARCQLFLVAQRLTLRDQESNVSVQN